MMLDERLIRDAISKCGLSQSVPQVIEKTKEMLRIMNIKMPTGYLKKAEICRHLYAIEHACQALGLSFDKTKLQEQAPVTKKIYLEGLMSCSQIDTTAARQNLHVNLPGNKGQLLVLSRLAIHYGHDLQTAARHILMQYKKIYIDKLPENQQSLVNINSAVCQAAAFYVAGTKTKVSFFREQYY